MFDNVQLDRSDRTRPRQWLDGTRLDSALLSNSERQALADAALPKRSVGAHADLLREGDRDEHLYVMNGGWACRYKTMRDGSRQIVALSLPGDVVNLDVLTLDRLGYGVRTISATVVVPLPRRRVNDLADEHAGIARLVMRLGAIENSIVDQNTLLLGRYSADQRVAHLLCELSVRIAGDAAGVKSFKMPLTQEQIGDTAGLTGVHVNRTIKKLRGLGLIGQSDRSILIHDWNRLRRLAEFDAGYLHLAAT